MNMNACRLLGHPDDDLVLAVLDALSKVGDGRAVTSVERVAAHGRTAPLREAAQRVLPILQERRQRERDAARLLRAADAPHMPDDVLLRPAQSTGRIDPELLLNAIRTIERASRERRRHSNGARKAEERGCGDGSPGYRRT